MARIHLLVLLIAAFIALASAASAPTFCKCTCFRNSTIIPLGPAHQSEDSSSSPALLRRQQENLFAPESQSESDSYPGPKSSGSGSHIAARSASTSCSACTKAFCLSQGIDFCKDAEEEDVITQCFQRDSNKDRIIVWGFILVVLGLLGWTAFKRVVEYRDARAAGAGLGRQNINYTPVGGGQ